MIKVDRPRQQRFIIGSTKQKTTEFTPESWAQRKVGFWQSGIIRGAPGTAPIFAEAEQAGTYEFSLRRWPQEVNQPIRSSANLIVPDGFTGATKKEQGKALPIVKARLKVAGFDKTIDVTNGMLEATFRVPLKKGDCDIQVQFIGDDGKEYGAYFLYVKQEN